MQLVTSLFAKQVFVKEGELVKIAARSDQKNVRVLLLVSALAYISSATIRVRNTPGISVLTDYDDVLIGCSSMTYCCVAIKCQPRENSKSNRSWTCLE